MTQSLSTRLPSAMHQDLPTAKSTLSNKTESNEPHESFFRPTNGLPSPKSAEKCPLFSVFYSEFDIKVGPVICFQTPRNFMDQDINISTEKIHEILSQTFDTLNSKAETETDPREENQSVTLPEGSLSIFDSTSEYIITGNELTGKIITLSTHEIHIMTRPTVISDERYERNSLLFSVGIVLRRAADPRPFRPLISKLALTLRSMEIESQFLSNPSVRPQLQSLLERILVSMNSSLMECNLLLSGSNSLNLKLFHPPKPETSPVHDHEVPILLRRDFHLQMYEWDLAINWCLMHIDGVTTTHQISVKAEVDLEMVRACLRVLKHHGIIAMVDMFVYSNRYEFTPKATAMLAGRESNLLQEAVDFVMKKPGSNAMAGVVQGNTGDSGSEIPQTGSPLQFTPSASYPPRSLNLLGGSQRSSHFRYAMMLANSLENVSSVSTRREEHRNLKLAVSELYCACHRNVSFGDLWVALIRETPVHTANSQRPNRKTSIGEEVSDRDTIDSLAFSPIEANQLDSLRKSNAEGHVDWENFFERFDHRRFFSFGLVHDLVVRVHEYPYFPGIFPERRTKQKQANMDSKKSLRTDYLEERSYLLAKHVASLMDGTRCDDEFVCIFEKPYNKLVQLVEKFSGKKVVSLMMAS